jgi:serine/threonine protein kinase
MTYQTGQQLGNYRLVRLLGQGGFAEVYLAKHIYLHTQAAIKVLQIQLTSGALQNFLREARIIANLEHPNIVRVLEFGIEKHRPYLVMNYAANGTLRQRYPRGHQLTPTTAHLLLKQTVAALHYAHSHKIIHRDIKPENMLFGAQKTVLLSDFGLALEGHSTYFSQPADNAGTMLYMAPEQFRGNPCTASDQYSLGVVVYEWLSGTLPFTGTNSLAIAVQHAHLTPTPLYERVPGLPITLSNVVMRTLEKDPQARFPHIQDFAAAFAEARYTHTSLFTNSHASQRHTPGNIEAQSAHISAEAIARISARSAPDTASTQPFDSHLRFSQEYERSQYTSNQTRPLIEKESRAQTQVLKGGEGETRPASPHLHTQYREESKADIQAPISEPLQRQWRQHLRKEVLFCIVGILLLALSVTGFWEMQHHDATLTPRELTQGINLNPHLSTTTAISQSRMHTPLVISGAKSPNSITQTSIDKPGMLPANQVTATPAPSDLMLSIPGATPASAMRQETSPSPTPTPDPTDPTNPTPMPTTATNIPLAVSITQAPNVVQNNSRVVIQVTTNTGNCDVRLRVIYNPSARLYKSPLSHTDSNGNATLEWDVTVSHAQIKYTIATLIVSAYSSDGQTAFSLPVTVQIM